MTEKKNKPLERIGQSDIHEYMYYLRSPKKILWNNFLVGIARGFGLIIGMTVVVAVFLFVVQYLGGLPVIGNIFRWLGEEILKGKQF